MVTTTDVPIKGYNPSKAAFAKYLVRSLTLKDIERVPRNKLPTEIVDPVKSDDKGLPAKSSPGSAGNIDPKKLRVGIIGAGISGLYTALVLDFLGIQYEILEANPDRYGGRLYTHYFEKAKNQYYDIGAMRFPESPVMARTFKLFDRTKTELKPYIMSCPEQPMRYNDLTKILPQGEKKWENDPFKVSTVNNGPVPPQTVKNPDEILDDAYYPYRRKIKRALDAYVKHEIKTPKDAEWDKTEKKLLEDLERAWQYLMQHDKFSLRDYLSFVEGQDDDSIHWLETLNAGTGWFDEAFSENVMESLAFEYNKAGEPKEGTEVASAEEEIKWWYIVNGTSSLTQNVWNLLSKKPEMGKLVTDMQLEGTSPKDHQIHVKVRGEEKPRVYDTVFCSTTFAAMQKMDLTGLALPYAMKAAIRSLRYDPSTKVAIQFKEPWWITSDEVKKAGGLTGIKGGLGKTDMPLRTCVYPSYNIQDTGEAVLLCSYTWGQDSERIASMINPVPTNGETKTASAAEQEALLKETMIDNLARLHSTDEDGYEKMKALIGKSYKTHHAYDWSKDPYTCGGAFALYSPAQFRCLYPSIVRPAADSRLHVIGEAASAHHAWIVGALDSSARGLYLMLERFKLDELQKKMVDEFGPAGEVDDGTAHLQVALGMLNRKDVPITTQVI